LGKPWTLPWYLPSIVDDGELSFVLELFRLLELGVVALL
jgi:hypothetical protein